MINRIINSGVALVNRYFLGWNHATKAIKPVRTFVGRTKVGHGICCRTAPCSEDICHLIELIEYESHAFWSKKRQSNATSIDMIDINLIASLTRS